MVDMSSLQEPKTISPKKKSDSFEELTHQAPKKKSDEEEKSPAKGSIFSRFLPKFSGFAQ
jgi:hypothetical protein